ncbi:MAG TPA: ferritin-like domain-containing protein [Candidatus Limnocylindrales bacterium]|nr:ferritin-like domain-containing protein [Candidatus Limnocylindrales bacterium]
MIVQTAPSNATNRIDEADPVWLMNQYRSAEVHGAGAIMRMGRLAESSELQASLSRHLRDEAVHAWLWTRAIEEFGGEIVDVDEPYQSRLAAHFGIPRNLVDMLALTWASERRGLAQYSKHLDQGDVPSPIKRTLRGIIKDEKWHVDYIREELERRALSNPAVQRSMDRALEADLAAVNELRDLSATVNAAGR